MTGYDLWCMLAGERGFLPMRCENRTFWRGVGDPDGFVRAVEAFAYMGDAEVGAVPHLDRDWRFAGRSHVLWAQGDTPKARAALAVFDPAPTLVLAAGSSRTALWALSRGLDERWTVRLNRRLAHALGMPKKHCGVQFMFHPPGAVLREGRKRPVAVAVESWTGGLHGAKAVAGRLPDAPDPDAWKDRAGDRRLLA